MPKFALQAIIVAVVACAIHGLSISAPPANRGTYDHTTGTYRKAIEHVDVVGSARCQYPNCNREDFLPMQCQPCGKFFCKDHFSTHIAENPACQLKDRLVIPCPICEKNIVPAGILDDGSVDEQKANEFYQAHMSKCKGKKKKAARCPVEGCNKKIPKIPLTCKCGVNYCMDHRLPETHDCPTLRQTQAPARSRSTQSNHHGSKSDNAFSKCCERFANFVSSSSANKK